VVLEVGHCKNLYKSNRNRKQSRLAGSEITAGDIMNCAWKSFQTQQPTEAQPSLTNHVKDVTDWCKR